MLKNALHHVWHWETWHWFVKYIPILPVWAWYSLRSGSLCFFTSSNPGLTFGGFFGETKREMYGQLPPLSYPKSVYITPAMSYAQVEQLIADAGLVYPVAAKPDVGLMGLMFRKIDTPGQMARYHSFMPVNYIVQRLINYPLEVSVFYYRFPGNEKGTITGFLKKEGLEVTGDGQSTLRQLIKDYPRARFRLDEMLARHQGRLDAIILKGETFCLSYALNLSRGGRLVSLAHEKDEALLTIFDGFSHYTKTFYGRYDIKCLSIADLKQGKNFLILEYNGCGAEPHHVYGNGNTLLQAWKILLCHWGILYHISRNNNKKGVAYWDNKKGVRYFMAAYRHFKLLKQLDGKFESASV